MEKVTFNKKGLFGAKGETREVTDSAALQYAKLGVIADGEKVIASVEKKRKEAAVKAAKEKALSEKIAAEKLAARQGELAKEKDVKLQAQKELKKDIETKEEKHAAKTTKAPRL